MNVKGAFFVIIVLFLISPIATAPGQIVSFDDNKNGTFQIAEADVEQMFLDVDLHEEPDYHIVGDSGEFSYFHSAFYDDDAGVSMMTWDHVANTNVTTDDGVYFSKSFDYDYDVLPRNAHLSFDFAVDLAGDFTYSSAMRDYGKIVTWIVNPYGQEYTFGLYRIPYGYYYEKYTHDMYIDNAWDTFLEDTSPDKNTTFSVCIGLFPNYDFFLNSSGIIPWQYYSGSMTLLVKSLDLLITQGTLENSTDVATPIYESRWKTTAANKANYPPSLTHQISDWRKDLAIMDDGSVVSLIQSHYGDDGTYSFDDMVLLRWGTSANLIWSKRVYDCEPYALATDGQTIFATGTKNGNAFLTRWSLSGTLLWNKTWSLGLEAIGYCVAADSNGSSYLYVKRWNETGWRYEDNYLFKVDENGEEVWQKYLNQTAITAIYTENATAYYTMEGTLDYLRKWSPDGDLIASFGDSSRNYSYIDYYRPLNGDLIMLRNSDVEDEDYPREEWSLLTLQRLDEDGLTVWDTEFSIRYWPDFKEEVLVNDVEVAPDGSILILFYLGRFAEEYRLYRFFNNGTLDWYKVVEWMPKRGVINADNIVCGNNGLVYFTVSEYETWESYYGDPVVLMRAYIYGDYSPPLIPVQFTSYVYVGAGIAVLLAISLIYDRKRKLSVPSE